MGGLRNRNAPPIPLISKFYIIYTQNFLDFHKFIFIFSFLLEIIPHKKAQYTPPAKVRAAPAGAKHLLNIPIKHLIYYYTVLYLIS